MTLSGMEFVACHRVCRSGSLAGVSHLLVAADALSAEYWGSSQIAVCGAEVHLGSGTAVDAEEDPRYCPACVRAAVRWNSQGATQ